MNDQYKSDHVNTFEENHYQSEQAKTLENDRFYDKSLETPIDTPESDREVASPPEKTEPWKQSFAPVDNFTPISTPKPAVPAAVNTASPEMLFPNEETQNFRSRWNDIQAKFVDEPSSTVREADTLVAEVMAKITKMFADQRQTLESQWSKGDTSTEDLRQVLQHYRTFFNRLLK